MSLSRVNFELLNNNIVDNFGTFGGPVQKVGDIYLVHIRNLVFQRGPFGIRVVSTRFVGPLLQLYC